MRNTLLLRTENNTEFCAGLFCRFLTFYNIVITQYRQSLRYQGKIGHLKSLCSGDLILDHAYVYNLNEVYLLH